MQTSNYSGSSSCRAAARKRWQVLARWHRNWQIFWRGSKTRMHGSCRWAMISSSAATKCISSIPEKRLLCPHYSPTRKEEPKLNKTPSLSSHSCSATPPSKRKTCACSRKKWQNCAGEKWRRVCRPCAARREDYNRCCRWEHAILRSKWRT